MLLTMLGACQPDDALIGDPVSTGDVDGVDSLCGSFSDVDVDGASWTFRWDDAVGYDGSWTDVATGGTSWQGESVYEVETTGASWPAGRDSYTWTAEAYYTCDAQGVWEVWRRQVTTDVLTGGDTVVSDYSYYYVDPVRLWPQELAVGDSWTRAVAYDVYDGDAQYVISADYVQELEVVGEAEIEVAAGRYDALVLEADGVELAVAEDVGLLYWTEVSELVSFTSP